MQFNKKKCEKQAKKKEEELIGILCFSKNKLIEEQKFHNQWNQPVKCGFAYGCFSQEYVMRGFSDV